MLNALIVVWRESLEAMLVIGVLLAWIGRQPQPQALRRGVWLGTLAGAGLALLLALATFVVQSQFAGQSLEVFQLLMVLVAAGLIFQMVLWMHSHGRHMKSTLESQASQSASAWGVGAITALAVAREGAETVVFVYGLGLQAAGTRLMGLLGAVVAGMALAGLTAWIIARGARFLNYRTLFRISEILLLLIAGALLANAIDRMISLDWLNVWLDPLWDSSHLVDDAKGLGSLLASFIGYRARPSGILLVSIAAFWALAIWQMRRSDRRAA
jgi:high-affinity iron transporter